MKSLSILLTQAETERLVHVLGGPENLSIQEEPEFLEETGCPPQKLDLWLSESWIQCDIGAVLDGQERVGPQPVLLIHREGDQSAARLIYPKKELLLQNIGADGLDQMRATIASHPLEAAEEIISQIEALARACANRELPTIKIQLLWKAVWIAVCALLPFRELHITQICRLLASMRALDEACQQRGADPSPQGRYSEARLNSRCPLRENHNPVLDDFPELVEIATEHCSRELAQYVLDEVGLPCDDYLDAVEMMARDGCDPVEVANPPARVRSALRRKQSRIEQRERQRWSPLTNEQADGWTHPDPIEARVIANIDWEHGKAAVHLPEDQTRALEVKMDGLNLQSSAAGEEMEWETPRVKAVRRSLGPDRPLGKSCADVLQLNRRFAAYKTVWLKDRLPDPLAYRDFYVSALGRPFRIVDGMKPTL